MKSASGFPWALSSLLLALGCGANEAAPEAPNDPAAVAPAPSDDTPNTPAPEQPPVEPELTAPMPITVRGVAVFQGVKLPVFGEDAKTQALPIVVDRPGVLRTYVDLRQDPQEVRVVLSYKAEDGSLKTLEQTRAVQQDSDDDVDASCIDIALPAELFHASLEIAVEVFETTHQRRAARYPEAEGSFAPLPANPQTKALEVVIVPVQYQADGSNRLPDTSDAQVQRLSEELRALYPVSEARVRVRSEPLVWTDPIRANGRGWDELLYGILQLRETDGAADNVYYYGAFSPATSLQSFCSSGGCVLGLSELSRDVGDAGRRGSIGLGYTGGDAAETFVHELGHAHGRYHAPCGGAGGPDSRFPYTSGGIGVPGWDVRTGTFVRVGGRRDATKDFMGYCSPSWVSDYTWKALFSRIVGIGEEIAPLSSQARVRYHLLRLEDGQAPRWIGSRTASGVASRRVAATLPDGSVEQLPEAELDHLSGSVVYVPARLSGQRVRVAGATVTVP